MKVLEILGSLHRGGAETMIMNYYRAFDKSICQFDFIIHAEFDDDYRNEARKLGATIILLDRPGEVGAIKYIKELTEKIRQFGPYDAVHIHTNHQAFLAMIAAHQAGIKNIIVHSHTTFFNKKYVIINRFFMKLFNTKRVACGIAAGKAFFGKETFEVLNNAIDIEKFKDVSVELCSKKKIELFGNSVVIGHLGRLTKQKNHEFIIDLAEEISKDNSDIIFACYGEGEDAERLKNIVIERKISNVKFMGVTENVVMAYRMFDLFILPSLWEGFPVTLVESQLSGIFSMTSDNVSKECDLNIDMLQYLPLDIKVWKTEILNNLAKKKSCMKNVDSILDLYDVNKQWKKLYRIYRGEILSEL